ncbi:hypothetical protein BH24CHL7_BH24CHL7_17230 [soil metagenome]
MATGTRRLALVATVIAGSLLALMPVAASAATRPITFDLYMDSNCINGRLSDDAAFKVVWRDGAGVLKLKEVAHMAGSSGYWSACADPVRLLAVGDRIKVTVGAIVRTFVIPKLTLNVDRAANVFKGKAPSGSAVHLSYQPGIFADYTVGKTVQADAKGRWSYRKAGLDIWGGIYADIRWNSPKNDQISLYGVAPVLTATIGSPRITGSTRSGTTVKAKLLNAATMALRARATGVAGGNGEFSMRMRDTAGNPVPVKVGNRLRALSLAEDADWIVPGAEVSANVATDTVTGRCHDAGTSDGLYWVRIIAPGDGEWRGHAIGYGDANGDFEIDFTEVAPSPFYKPADVQPGDTIQLMCLQTTGDWVELRRQVP